MTSEALRRLTLPLFANLTDQEISELLASSNRWTVAPKMRLFSSGVSPAHLLLLRSGQAKYFRLTESGKEEVLCWLAPNDCLGLGAILNTPAPNLGTAESVTLCEFIAWNASQARNAAEEHPQMAINALRLSLSYVARMLQRNPCLPGSATSQKIARALLTLCNEIGVVTPQGINVAVTTEQLAAFAEASPLDVSRVVSSWRNTRFVTRGAETIRVHSPEFLAAESFSFDSSIESKRPPGDRAA